MGKKWPESAALRQVWPSTPRIARTLHAFLSFCQQCLIDLIVGKRLKSQSYHARTWISPSKNLQFLEVFPPESWASAKRQARQVRRSAMSSYLRWILRLLSVSPDEAIIEEIAQKPDEAGYGPSIEMNYMAKLRPDLWYLWSFSFHSDEDGDAYRY